MWKGCWRGEYAYTNASGSLILGKPVAFSVQIEECHLGRFKGTICEDPLAGVPGVGTLEGRCWSKFINFVKQMPVFSTHYDGKSQSLSEYLADVYEETLPEELPHPAISYQGRWETKIECYSGRWYMEPVYLILPGGQQVQFQGVSGTWQMRQDISENLLRASKQPVEEQQILLRAAKDHCETPSEQLIRPVEKRL